MAWCPTRSMGSEGDPVFLKPALPLLQQMHIAYMHLR